MKIKDNLNLNGYILQNFCIDNYDSLDGINDKGTGRAVFLTGNSTNAGYGHVNVYDGTSFKALAYVDDVANNEAFQSLEERVKYLEGDLDLTDTINNLNDLEAFLAGFYESNGSLMGYLNTELGKKLNTSGGTIESENYDAFKIKRTIDAGAYITFENKNGRLGSIGFEQSTNKPILYRGATTSQIDYILHSGNVGDYALKNYDNQWNTNFNEVFYNGIQYAGSNSSNAPLKDAVLVSFFVGDSSWQIIGGRNNNKLMFRSGTSHPSGWNDWKTIAFTDSDITGYAAGLKHSNGTIGAILNSSGNVLIGTTTDSGAKLQVNGSASFGTKSGCNVFLNREDGYSYISSAHSIGFRVKSGNGYDVKLAINNSGNVLIGNTEDNGKGRLQVEGNLHVTGNIIADGEVSAGGAAEEGGNAGGGGAFHSEGIAVGATQTTIAHGLGTDDIVVSIYEKDGVSGRWSIILTDVEVVDANNIIVSFGSATTVEHKVVIMGAVA